MPLYGLLCRACGAEKDAYAPIAVGKGSTACTACDGVMTRRYTPPAIAKPWTPHWNAATGQWCETEKDFTQALRRGSEEASRVMGRDVNYTRIDPQDAKPSSEEGLAEQAKVHRDRGWTEPTRKVFT